MAALVVQAVTFMARSPLASKDGLGGHKWGVIPM